jgi:hypothetical protein
VKFGVARAGGRRPLAGSTWIALTALALACPTASAQLPNLGDTVKLPVKGGAARDLLPGDTGQVVDDVVGRPLPGPVEEVVESSPVAPVRDELRRVVDQTTDTIVPGGVTGGSGTSGSGATAGGGTSAGAGDTGAPSGGGTPARGGVTAAPGRDAAPTPTRPGSAPAGGRRSADSDRRGPASAAIRTIESVIKAVPTAIWIALGVLSLLALALAGRTFVERRRAQALARDREQLLGDVAVLERTLLPAVPEQLGAMAASVAYRSWDGPAAGGDFYDAFELPGGRAAVIVGDISGHGADALEGTNSVRAQLHALLETGVRPRAALAVVGERTPVQLAGRFSTVVVAIHDPSEGTLTYATAGHAPPVIVGPGAEEPLTVGTSPPVGVGLRTGLRETTVALPPGSLCCLYTDGLVEAKLGDGMIGRERFAEMVESLESDEQADVLLERVLDEADEICDDMTVCLLRPVLGVHARAPRVEVLELDPDDIDSGFAARFLEACLVPRRELATTVDQARTVAASGALPLIEITIAAGVGRAQVSAAPSVAPAASV